MRFLFKTDYAQDVRLFKHGGQVFWYGLLGIALMVLPFMLPEIWREYFLGQMVFIWIYSIVGLGMMLLIGFTGQISLGHAAFMAVGAYTEALLAAKGVPFVVSLSAAALLSALVGVIIGMPALRLKGIYLAIATISFGFIVEEIVTRWDSVTGGNSGKTLKAIDLFGLQINDDIRLYYLCLAILVIVMLGIVNLMRSPTGRAFVAIRDSEVSAQSMGINLAYYKTVSFAISAALAGIAGALYAHKISFISPRAVRTAAVDRVGNDRVHRRPGLVSRRGLRRRVHHFPAGTDRPVEGLPAGIDRRPARHQADHFRADPDRLPAVRAARHLRALVQDPHVFRTVSFLSPRHVPAAALVHQVGPAEMNCVVYPIPPAPLFKGGD